MSSLLANFAIDCQFKAICRDPWQVTERDGSILEARKHANMLQLGERGMRF